MNKTKALPIYVYRQPAFGDCTNFGISSRYDELLCLCPDGFMDVDLDDPPENLVKIVKRGIFGDAVYHIEPVAPPTDIGWMAGGNYAATCDTRFSRMIGGMYGAVAIHDRQETKELHELLSR